MAPIFIFLRYKKSLPQLKMQYIVIHCNHHNNISPILPAMSPWLPQFYSVSMSSAFLDSTHVWDCAVCVTLCLTFTCLMSSRLIYPTLPFSLCECVHGHAHAFWYVGSEPNASCMLGWYNIYISNIIDI